MIKVSVIVPVYNTQQYLRDCLDSILQQTLDDIEIICIDDGSTDASLEILSEYANRFEQVSVYTEENAGQGAARNYGVSVAQGKYLCFVDSDDLIVPDALERLYVKAEADALDVLFSDIDQFADSSEFEQEAKDINNQEQFVFTCLEDGKVYDGRELLELIFENRKRRGIVYDQLFNRDFYLKNNFHFPEKIIYEDEVVAFESMVSAQRAGYIAQKLYRRRIRSSSTITTTATFKNAYSYLAVYLEMVRFCCTQTFDGAHDDAIQHYMKRILTLGKKLYAKLTPEEREVVQTLPSVQRQLFEVLVSDAYDLQEKLKQARRIKNSRTYKVGDTILRVSRKIKGSKA